MADTENLASFVHENKRLLKDYLDTRLQIFRLQVIALTSKIAGRLIWAIISMFLFFLVMVFAGLVTGFWLSDIMGSYVKGFGWTTLIMLAIIIILALLRNVLFVNPIVRQMISLSAKEQEKDNN